MGMYTQLVSSFELREDTPEDVVEILKFMMGYYEIINVEFPQHELFNTIRWDFMLVCDSAYFDETTESKITYQKDIGRYFVDITCNFKNYDDELEKFIDWIKPYIYKTKDLIGYKWYEEWDKPKYIYI